MDMRFAPEVAGRSVHARHDGSQVRQRVIPARDHQEVRYRHGRLREHEQHRRRFNQAL